MKSIITLVIMAICSLSFAQNNLLDTSTWTVGNGSVTGFSKNGTDAENIRELSTDPFGNQSILWKAVPNGSNDADGGWNTNYLAADNTKTYRFGVWIKKTNSNDGETYFGVNSRSATATLNTFRLDGTLNNNPYFYGGYDLPELDKWYLLIGFLHNSGYTGTSNIGGVYDPVTGNKVQSLTDYKMGANSVEIRHRAYLYYDTNTADRQFFYNPTIYEVNGQELTIQQLLNPNSGSGSEQNVALGKTATQSSLYGDAIEGQASNAVDGNTDGIRANQSTTHTLNEPVMWWRLDLGAAYDVTQIKVYNRTDCCTARITGAQVYIGNTDSTNPNDYTTAGGSLSDLHINDINGISTSGRYVMVRLATGSSGAFLALAEVEVYGSLSNGGGNGGSTVWNTSGNNINYTAGKVGVGTATIPNDYLFAVNGKIISEELKVQLHSQWPDYVFSPDYSLPTLEEVEKHIQENGHLINMPSASEVETNGIEVGEMNKLLLEKIEELTLYVIELKKELEYTKNHNHKNQKQ